MESFRKEKEGHKRKSLTKGVDVCIFTYEAIDII